MQLQNIFECSIKLKIHPNLRVVSLAHQHFLREKKKRMIKNINQTLHQKHVGQLLKMCAFKESQLGWQEA